jgi:hypothetical protein
LHCNGSRVIAQILIRSKMLTAWDFRISVTDARINSRLCVLSRGWSARQGANG